MTPACSAISGAGARGDEGRGAAAPLTVRWLAFAATPTFAIMALLTGVSGAAPMDMLCSSGNGSALGGMVPMYLLMSVFHSLPWLKLASGRRRAPG